VLKKVDTMGLGDEGGIVETAEGVAAAAAGIAEGGEYTLRVGAKDAQGFGIGRHGGFVVFVKNAKTRIGNTYKVKVSKVHRTFAYADVCESRSQMIGNGSLIKL
jgi:predicted RNA-binding protein with TRAM domain